MEKTSTKTKALVDQEANRVIGSYRSANDPVKKIQASTALTLLALISTIFDDDETIAKQLLTTVKDVESGK